MTRQPDNGGRIAFIGECMVELQEHPDGKLHRSFAGDTLNSALYMARLKSVHHHQVYYVTALGQDRFSTTMLEQWQQEGIRCNYVRRVKDKLPGLYFVDVDVAGERSFHYWRDQSAARGLFSGTDSLTALTTFDYLYLSGISAAILPPEGRKKLLALLQAAKNNGAKVVFDNNYRPKLWQQKSVAQQWYRDILAATSIACLTFDDERELWGDSASAETFERCQALGIEETVIKQGAGPCLIERRGERYSVTPRPIARDLIIDTNAAGDSFSAGYLAGRLGGHNPQASAVLGHQIAAAVIQHRGAIIPLAAMPEMTAPSEGSNYC
ncbi:sugar kinase [Exilibacterium tricleocarpae]|uniref:2-dehydro-3-deoxygluconokinase n=1 Tax=Exilibacterium tricleocarpae TaxID=2591008 RepID=A0A545SQM6_9GAMM|nr:sugar kinase [Exilibacterium tricleocarpae]TQV67283.1 sugar kinase [Exilibacterium tricleocarpae]